MIYADAMRNDIVNHLYCAYKDVSQRTYVINIKIYKWKSLKKND